MKAQTKAESKWTAPDSVDQKEPMRWTDSVKAQTKAFWTLKEPNSVLMMVGSTKKDLMKAGLLVQQKPMVCQMAEHLELYFQLGCLKAF